MWVRLLGLETPRIEAGLLVSRAWPGCWPLPWASIPSSIKWVKSHLAQGCGEDCEVPKRCSRDVRDPLLCLPWRKLVRAPALTRHPLWNGARRGLSQSSPDDVCSPGERIIFRKGRGPSDKVPFIRPSHFAKLRICTRASYTVSFRPLPFFLSPGTSREGRGSVL